MSTGRGGHGAFGEPAFGHGHGGPRGPGGPGGAGGSPLRALPARRASWADVDLGRATTALLMIGFFAGWVSFGFTLFDLGRFSITLQLTTSLGLALFVARVKGWCHPAVLLLAASGLTSWTVAATSPNYSARALTHVVQSGIAVGVAAAVLSLRWERQAPRLLRFCFWLVALVLAYEVYQFAARTLGLPGAFLPVTNQQLGDDLGFQRGYEVAAQHGFTRVSSFFPEPSDLGRFLLWMFCLGSIATRRATRWAMLGMTSLGILLSQSMGGILGLVFLVTATSVLTLDLRRLLTLAVVGLLALWGFVHAFPDAVAAVDERWERISTGGMAFLGTTGRFADVAANLELVGRAPWFGHGLGSLKEVAPQNVVASNYMLLLIERGVVGTCLFLAPFLWAWAVLALRGSRRDTLDVLALMLLTLELYLMVTFSALYFPPLYLSLGFGVLRAGRRTCAGSRRTDHPASRGLLPTLEPIGMSIGQVGRS